MKQHGLSRTDNSPIEWGQFVDISLDEINPIATPCESPKPTTGATQEPQTKKALQDY